ncbi:hypothetical protein HPB51_025491 [Rhipicephalus microplus]|uniref:PiggyBac transposable element-derived protein domain-containing protein n=1 Tax=Rhipicephalus microplus TaxID=6941 RepID=A0A9J6DRB5_RHIMP|nr:hypothetical protein HPB51_025491 [Rhipicephalus microplus]
MMVMCDFLSPGLEDHASKRQKVDDATAEEILMRISNGDISDGDFSDDELEAENEENIPANGQVTASTTTAALPARPDATVSSNAPAASTKAEFKWVKKDFAPSDVDCHYNPEVASTCQQPLVYFSKYFTEQIFEDLAEFTNSFDGLAHDFEFYQGKGTGVSKEHAHLGLGGSVVMRLVESLPKAQNIKCYMDNYFTSVKLFLELKKIGILASGTIRGNRLAGCVMKTDKEMKKEGRGSYDERVSQNDEVVLVRWQDNGTVNMASTHLGVGNIGTVRRWSESQKVHVDIDCPEVVLDYNKYMGGVDKLDFIMSLYPMRTRTKKWPVRVISHFASFALSNSWLEYLRDANKAGLLRKETLDMMAFQTDVANCLLNSNKPQKKRGRPSNDNSRTVKKKVCVPLGVPCVSYVPIISDPLHL